MPFQSKAQMRAAFGGHLGPVMKAKAHAWAHETPDLAALPAHKKPMKPKKKPKRPTKLAVKPGFVPLGRLGY